MVAADGAGSGPSYPPFDRGFTIVDVPTRDEALHWAQKFAVSCRCPQAVQQFHHDPES